MNKDEYFAEIEKIENNWNSTIIEKGNQLYELGKSLKYNTKQQEDCFVRAVHYYSNSASEACFCNLAHCYFLLARLFDINPEEYYRRSIEYHIKGSKSKKYQNEDFYKFYAVNDDNIDSVLRTIRLTKPSSLNDPTDSPIAQDGLSIDIFPNKTVFDGLRVGCFGRIKGKHRAWEDSSMWSYYGDMHKGICIRYRFFNNLILENKLLDKFIFKEIEYKEKFDFYRGIVADGFLTKTKTYENENEWRIVWYDRDFLHSSFYWSKDQNVYLPIGREYIYQIFIGCKTPYHIKQVVVDYAKGRNPEIPVIQIQPDNKNVFKLVGIQIN